MSRSGEWMCSWCQHLNFKKRESCYKCGCLKFGGGMVCGESTAETEIRPGDWFCAAPHCGVHNFASRPSCRRCSAPKSDHGYNGGYGGEVTGDAATRPGWKSGDWICIRPGCDEHNYASRTQCYRCGTPKDFSG